MTIAIDTKMISHLLHVLDFFNVVITVEVLSRSPSNVVVAVSTDPSGSTFSHSMRMDQAIHSGSKGRVGSKCRCTTLTGALPPPVRSLLMQRTGIGFILRLLARTAIRLHLRDHSRGCDWEQGDCQDSHHRSADWGDRLYARRRAACYAHLGISELDSHKR